MITFNVSDVKIPSKSLIERTFGKNFTKKISLNESINLVSQEKIEDGKSNYDSFTYQQFPNHFIGSIHAAFNNHYPLELSPDDVWTVLLQGFAQHINLNAEKFRDKFVEHEGKKIIRVVRNEFVKGKKNDWPGCFTEFSNEIKKQVKVDGNIFIPKFSTTSQLNINIFNLSLMDITQSFFDFRVMTMCGIPKITLLGSIEDWQDIRNRVENFSEFDLDWWIDKLIPILDQFINAQYNYIDLDFWKSIYKFKEVSGGDTINGWILDLIPYLKNSKDKTITIKNENIKHIGSDMLPSGLSQAPFIWEYWGQEIPMKFIGGFVGAHQKEDLTICPNVGWAVAER
jgi:hypothetical protein